jgi:hypothetical protein
MAMTVQVESHRRRHINLPVPTGGVTAGQFKQVEDICGFVFATVAEADDNRLESGSSNNLYSLLTQCDELEHDATTAATGSIGDKVYWSVSTSKLISTPATGDPLIGYYIQTKTNGQTTARIYFDSSLKLI